jgi:hypothetical protein
MFNRLLGFTRIRCNATDELLNLMSDRNHGVDDLHPECAVELRLSIRKGKEMP